MVEGWRGAGVDLSGAFAIRPSGRSVEGLRVVADLTDAGPEPSLVILGFKPQQLQEVAPELSLRITSGTTVLSILAGIEGAVLRRHFPNAAAIVRAVPNLPVAIRRGVIGLYSPDAADEMRQQLSQLFATLGYTVWTHREENLGPLGAVAGAGPAYVARFVDALAKAGVARGLSEELARTVALETVLGTAWMAAAQRLGMDELVRRIASPNGTTEAGLSVLERENVFDQLIAVTINASVRRGAEIADQARSLSSPQENSP